MQNLTSREGMENDLAPYLQQRNDVACAFLFGSHARGQAGPVSDIDVAVWLDDRLCVLERGRRRAEILAELMTRLNTNAVDVVVLNDAPPVLAFEVASDGKLLLSRAPELPVEFSVRAFRRYLDMERLRRTLARYLEERIAADRVTPPINPRVIQERLQHLEQNILVLRRLQARSKEEFLTDRALQWSVEHGLQTSIDAMLDVGTHLIGALGLPAPRDYTSVIDALGQHGIVPAAFAQRVRGMAGFRNVLVHEYLAG